jgi:hypothetical protein
LLNKGLNIPPEETVKKYDSSIQSLVNLIVSKQLYVHFHSALENSYSGWPLQSLANLLFIIETHSSSSKLATAYKKVK